MRLTEKRNGTYDKDNVLSNGMPRLDLKELKLSQLEDIEDDLGIDLATLFTALTKGIYYKDYNGEIKYINTPAIWLKVECYNEWLECHWVIEQHRVENYGKDWALTEGELL